MLLIRVYEALGKRSSKQQELIGHALDSWKFAGFIDISDM